MTAKLVAQAPGGQRHDFPLTAPVTTLGRSSACDLVLDYNYVSRQHARLEKTKDGYLIEDGGSTNGTFVNGRRISGQQMLASGDQIDIGELSLTFYDASAKDTAATLFRPMPSDSPIRCDSASWEVWVDDRKVDARLSLQEFELLSLLTSRYGRLCTREELGTAIWGRGNYDLNMLHRLVHRLKQKLGQELDVMVVSVAGKGYKLQAPDEGPAEQQGAAPAAFATVLFTDIEGSTTLTQRLGDATAQELLRKHNAIVRKALRANGGSEIKHTGDGIMASFPSVSPALAAALDIQRTAGAGASETPLRIRIGLNAGEPVAEDRDLFGTAVQLARRICDEAAGGEIFASNVVRELAAGKDFAFDDRGEVELKGFDSPVRLFSVGGVD